MKVSCISYFNPSSNKHYALKNFEYLTLKQKVRAIALTILAAIPSLGLFAIPVFRLLTKSTVPTQELARRCHPLRPSQNLSLSDISNDLIQIKRFLKGGGPIDQQDKEGFKGFTLLHYAVLRNRVDIMKFLIKNGASVKIQDNQGTSPLHVAAFKGYFEICKLLLEQGASINLQEYRGLTPLHIAIRMGNFEICKLLLDQGASVNQQGDEGYTPAHMAAIAGQIAILNLLIEKGADVDLVDKLGYTVLAKAKIFNPQNYNEVKQIITHQSSISKFSKRESYARHLLGHTYSLKGHSRLLPKKGSKMIPISLESSGGGRFWKEISREYQSLVDEHPINQDSKVIFLDFIQHATRENSAEDLFKRWSEGKHIVVNSGFIQHATTMVMIKDRFFVIDGAFPAGNNIMTRRMPAITEPIIKNLLELKKKGDARAYYTFMLQLLTGFEKESEQDRQIQKSLCDEVAPQTCGNCAWASRWGAAYVLYQSQGGKLPFSDVSTLTMCSQTNKYLDKLNDPQNLYLPSPMLLAELTSKLKAEKSSPLVKAKADQTIARLTEAWNALFHYPTADLAEDVKKEWLEELEKSKLLIQST